MTFRVADLMLEPVVAAPFYQAKGTGHRKCDKKTQDPCNHCTKQVTCEPCTRGRTAPPSTCTSDTSDVMNCTDCDHGGDPWAKLLAAMREKLAGRFVVA